MNAFAPTGIPPDAPKVVHGGEAWVQLWDPDEKAAYWYCERTQEAQWNTPGMPEDEYYDSGYESGGAMTDYSVSAIIISIYSHKLSHQSLISPENHSVFFLYLSLVIPQLFFFSSSPTPPDRSLQRKWFLCDGQRVGRRRRRVARVLG